MTQRMSVTGRHDGCSGREREIIDAAGASKSWQVPGISLHLW